MMTLPNFLIPGASKSGTSFVASVLNQHQDIFIPETKEPAFFSRYPNRGNYDEGIKNYTKLFARYQGEKYIGEASTLYMYASDAPALIKKHLGDIPLFFILRHPIDRIYSNYWQNIKAGYQLPSFQKMLADRPPLMQEMLQVSLYGQHIARYRSFFSEQNMHILFFDDLVADPESFFLSILNRLGLPFFEKTPNFSQKVNTASVPRIKVLSRTLQNQYLARWARRMPRPIYQKIHQWTHSIRKSLYRPIDYPPLDKETQKKLLDIFYPDIELLEELTQVDLSNWKKI